MNRKPKNYSSMLLDIYSALEKTYGPQKCFLEHSTPFELLVCAILSAQCTDRMVNIVSPDLFKRFPSPQSLADAKVADVEKIIKSIGLYKAKAKNIVACARIISGEHGGEVPPEMEKLVKLPGVGRKTANVVLGNAFGIPSFPVDTHVGRVMNRLGMTMETNPEKIESFVNMYLPQEKLVEFSHLIIQHGRKRCKARKPDCPDCEIRKYCATFEKMSKRKTRGKK